MCQRLFQLKGQLCLAPTPASLRPSMLDFSQARPLATTQQGIPTTAEFIGTERSGDATYGAEPRTTVPRTSASDLKVACVQTGAHTNEGTKPGVANWLNQDRYMQMKLAGDRILVGVF